MPAVKWNPELASFAELNVKSCTMYHDDCHNTLSFQYAGQNVAKMMGSSFSGDVTPLIGRMVDNWWSEIQYATSTGLSNIQSG